MLFTELTRLMDTHKTYISYNSGRLIVEISSSQDTVVFFFWRSIPYEDCFCLKAAIALLGRFF